MKVDTLTPFVKEVHNFKTKRINLLIVEIRDFMRILHLVKTAFFLNPPGSEFSTYCVVQQPSKNEIINDKNK